MLTQPTLHHLVCLPNLWACLPKLACLFDPWVCLPPVTPPPSILAQSVGMLAPLHGILACLICGHAYPTGHRHFPTWHACLICGHAYPTCTPPRGTLAGSVGMLTHPALRLESCLPVTLEHACSTSRQYPHMLTHICGHDMPPPFPVVQLSGMLAILSNVCRSFSLSMHVQLTMAFVTVHACLRNDRHRTPDTAHAPGGPTSLYQYSTWTLFIFSCLFIQPSPRCSL